MHLFLVTPSIDVQRNLQGACTVLLDSQGTLHRRLGAQTTTLYLLRPDGYIGYRSQPAQTESLYHYMIDVLGIQKMEGLPTPQRACTTHLQAAIRSL